MPRGNFKRKGRKYTEYHAILFTKEQEAKIQEFMTKLKEEMPNFSLSDLIRASVMEAIGENPVMMEFIQRVRIGKG